jgi:hypothetical protein
MVDRRIENLFSDYGKSFSALDLHHTANLYADQFIAAGPKGIISQTREEFDKNAGEAAEYYRKVGQKSAEVLSMKEDWFSDQYVMVTIHWGAHFEKLEKPYEFDVSYLVQLTDDKPKIILFISHEDEDEAMKEVAKLQQNAA